MAKKIIPALIVLAIILALGCEKEKTITSTEYIHDIEYVEGPTDTVFHVDTLLRIDTLIQHDSTNVAVYDTVLILDTVMILDTMMILDTVLTVDTLIEYSVDTVTLTEYIHDTTVLHDTVHQVDTVVNQECLPYVHFAFASMAYYGDQEVLDYINSEYGYSDGWIYYLSLIQTEVTSPSTGVYDFFGYVDYWTPDWSGYLPLEYYWRVTFLGDDPSDPDNWQLSDPPTASPGKEQGIHLSAKSAARMPGR